MMQTTMERLRDHYNESLQYFPEDRIVGIFLQGSQNYKLETPNSDVDSKLIVVPTFENIAFNKKPVSTTHIRANNEHIDFKDLRLMIETFKKQNLNFIEILFTPYKIVNPKYEQYWNQLVQSREQIARYNKYLSVKAMKGVAFEKFHALEHKYPSKIAILEQYGYDPKQLHHLLRVEEYLERYIKGESYQNCLIPCNIDYLIQVKTGKYNKIEAEIEAERALDHIVEMSNSVDIEEWNKCDPQIDKLFKEVQYSIMTEAVRSELMK